MRANPGADERPVVNARRAAGRTSAGNLEAIVDDMRVRFRGEARRPRAGPRPLPRGHRHSANAIRAVHRGEFAAAEELIAQASALLAEATARPRRPSRHLPRRLRPRRPEGVRRGLPHAGHHRRPPPAHARGAGRRVHRLPQRPRRGRRRAAPSSPRPPARRRRRALRRAASPPWTTSTASSSPSTTRTP